MEQLLLALSDVEKLGSVGRGGGRRERGSSSVRLNMRSATVR